MPSGQGFAFTRAVNNAGQPAAYFFPYKDPKWEAVNVPDLDDGHEGDYLTDRLTDEAIRFLQQPAASPSSSSSPTTPCTRPSRRRPG